MKSERKFPLIEIVTLLGVILYVGRSLYFANSAPSIGDEGAYLFKGLMFARGEYQPFQEYGFWTNKAPLAFLIPGYVQYWFGAGLRTARYFAVLVSVLMFAGVWITANRLTGKNWATLAVWVFALSDPQIATYSQALSQGLVACLMSWMLVFTLGKDRPLWQLALGSLLSVFVVMTRQNMIVVPPILILYIFWQHGWKAGWLAFTTGILSFVAFHALYWPGILQIWATWLPSAQTPFLDEFRIVGSSTGTFGRPSALALWQAFAVGVEDHFFVLCGFIAGIILWTRKELWKNPSQYKLAIFLGVLFLLLFLMHMWGSLFNDFCALCFTSYQMFFSMTGLLFVLVVFSNGVSDSKYRFPLLAITLVLFCAVLGLNYYAAWGDWLLDSLYLPRASVLFEESRLEFASLREVLTYFLQIQPEIQNRVASALGGVLIGGGLLALVWFFFRGFFVSRSLQRYSVNLVVISTFMIVGVVFQALRNFESYRPQCSTDFLTYYERAGRSLNAITPPDSLIYWKGSGRQLALLLYLDDIRYFPPQISAGAGHLIGDSDHLLKFGLYNDELDRQWKESADIYFIWRQFPTVRFEEFLDPTQYEPIPFEMSGLLECEDRLYIFEKLP
ncbi:MAG: glycosyltransferase family 39 protein [Anaerolineales bacterium]|nr:glycosyltransferase family 39 protein [Anaerolineales bacterium]